MSRKTDAVSRPCHETAKCYKAFKLKCIMSQVYAYDSWLIALCNYVHIWTIANKCLQKHLNEDMCEKLTEKIVIIMKDRNKVINVKKTILNIFKN